MNNQVRFILSPIADILKDSVSAAAGINAGIETYPLCDYIMQSTFIKMTGFQEQKMKAICWEMATNDYEYRYSFTQTPLGECSRYADKQGIYAELINQIKKQGLHFSNELIDGKAGLPGNIVSQIRLIFKASNLSVWAEYDFLNLEKVIGNIHEGHFANQETVLFSNNRLKEIYINHLYRQRNRIAHNTQSNQQNLPTLRLLMRDEHKYENYFVFFFILMLIDEIFMALFKKYLIALELQAS